MSTGSGSTVTSNANRNRPTSRHTMKRVIARLICLGAFAGAYLMGSDSIFKDSQSNTNEVFRMGPRPAQAQKKPEPSEVQALSQIELILRKTPRPTGQIPYSSVHVQKLLDMLKDLGIASTNADKAQDRAAYYAGLYKSVFKTDIPLTKTEFETAATQLRARLIAKQARVIGTIAAAQVVPVRQAQRAEEEARRRAAAGGPAPAGPARLPTAAPIPAPAAPTRLSTPVPAVGELEPARVAAFQEQFTEGQRDFVIRMGEEAKKAIIASDYNPGPLRRRNKVGGKAAGIVKLIDAETKKARDADSPAKVEEAFLRMRDITATVARLVRYREVLEEHRARWNTETGRKKAQLLTQYKLAMAQIDGAITEMLKDKRKEGKKLVDNPINERMLEALRRIDMALGKAIDKGPVPELVAAKAELAKLIPSTTARWTLKDNLKLPEFDIEKQNDISHEDKMDELRDRHAQLLRDGKADEAAAVKEDMEALQREARKKRADYALAAYNAIKRIKGNEPEFKLTLPTFGLVPPVIEQAREIKDPLEVHDRALAVVAGASAIYELDLALKPGRLLSPIAPTDVAAKREYDARFAAAGKARENARLVFQSGFERPDLPAAFPELAANLALEGMHGIFGTASVAFENSYLSWMRQRFDAEMRRDAYIRRVAELNARAESGVTLTKAEKKEKQTATSMAKKNNAEIKALDTQFEAVLAAHSEWVAATPKEKAYPVIEGLRLQLSWLFRDDERVLSDGERASRQYGRAVALRYWDESAAFARPGVDTRLRRSVHHPSADSAIIGGQLRGGLGYYLLRNLPEMLEQQRKKGYLMPDVDLAPLRRMQGTFADGYAKTKPANLLSPDVNLRNAEKRKYQLMVQEGNKEMIAIIRQIAGAEKGWGKIKAGQDKRTKPGEPSVSELIQLAYAAKGTGKDSGNAEKIRFLYDRAFQRYNMAMDLLAAYERNPGADLSHLSSGAAWAHPVRDIQLLIGAMVDLQDAGKLAAGLQPERLPPVVRGGRGLAVNGDFTRDRYISGDDIVLRVNMASKAGKTILGTLHETDYVDFIVYEHEMTRLGREVEGIYYALANTRAYGVKNIARLSETEQSASVFLKQKDGKWVLLDAREYGSKSEADLQKEGIKRIVFKDAFFKNPEDGKLKLRIRGFRQALGPEFGWVADALGGRWTLADIRKRLEKEPKGEGAAALTLEYTAPWTSDGRPVSFDIWSPVFRR